MFNSFHGFGHGDSGWFSGIGWIFLQDLGSYPGFTGVGFSWESKKEKLIDTGLLDGFSKDRFFCFWTVSQLVGIGLDND
jgi:hypothetical protein